MRTSGPIVVLVLLAGLGVSLPAQSDGRNREIRSNQTDPGNPMPRARETIELVRATQAEYLTVGKTGEGILILRGGILVKIGTRTVSAEVVKMSPSTGEIYAEGNIRFNDGKQVVTGEKFFFDASIGQGSVLQANSSSKPVFFRSQAFDILDSDRYRLRLAYFTTCDLEYPHYYFTASKLILTPDNEMFARNVVYHVGRTPVFYLPFVIQSNYGTGIITQYGFSQTHGNLLQNSYFIGRGKDSWYPKTLVFADWYQRTGELGGVAFSLNRPNLRYEIEAAVSNYRYKEAIQTPEGDIVFTNQIARADGSRGELNQVWYKVQADVNASSGSQKEDRRLDFKLQYADYRHRNWELEFGRRRIPSSTFEMFQIFPLARRRNLQNNLLWEARLDYATRDTAISVSMTRRSSWLERPVVTDSEYIPVFETLPKVTLFQNVSLIPGFGTFQGGWLRLRANGQINRFYQIGQLVQTQYLSDGNADVAFYYKPLTWFSYEPAVGLGYFLQDSREQRADIVLANRRATYTYLQSANQVRIGYPVSHLQLTHILRYSLQEKSPDPVFDTIRTNYAEAKLAGDKPGFGNFTAAIARDLREYPYPVEERRRWSDAVAKGALDFDLLEGYPGESFGLMLQKRRHFVQMSLRDTYIHRTAFDRPLLNSLEWYIRAGGYKSDWFRELIEARIGFQFINNYIDARQSQLLLTWNLSMQLDPYWRIDAGANARADNMERYSPANPTYVPFFQDIWNSLNAFQTQNTVMNLQRFYLVLEHDLHDWVFSISFQNTRRVSFFGAQLRDYVYYYEQSVFFSFTVKDFGSDGSRLMLYRNNPLMENALR